MLIITLSISSITISALNSNQERGIIDRNPQACGFYLKDF